MRVFWPTFVAIIWYFAQVNKVGSYGNVVDLIWVSYLDLDTFAEWREQLGEDNLLVPDRFIATLLDWSLPLETQDGVVMYEKWSIKIHLYQDLWSTAFTALTLKEIFFPTNRIFKEFPEFFGYRIASFHIPPNKIHTVYAIKKHFPFGGKKNL